MAGGTLRSKQASPASDRARIALQRIDALCLTDTSQADQQAEQNDPRRGAAYEVGSKVAKGHC